MMRFCSPLKTSIQTWLRDYDKIQSFAVILIYVQIGCALVGSLGASYNGVLLINLAIALFGLVAIESGSQRLGRTYAILLFFALVLDVTWMMLFSNEIWHISSLHYGVFFIFSVKLTFSMEIAGFIVRLSSSLLWVQIYRLGVSHLESAISQEADFDLRSSFLNPTTPAMVRQSSDSEDPLGGSIYDPAYYSSLFEAGQANTGSPEVAVFSVPPPFILHVEAFPLLVHNHLSAEESSSYVGGRRLKLSGGRSLNVTDDASSVGLSLALDP